MSAHRVGEGQVQGEESYLWGLPGDGAFAAAVVSLIFAALGNGTWKMLSFLTFGSPDRRRPGMCEDLGSESRDSLA